MMNTRTMATTLDRVRTLNRALDEAFAQATGAAAPYWIPAIDVAERSDAYVIVAELPGVSPDQVELSFENNVLTIHGTKTASFSTQKDGELRVYTLERQSGEFSRSIRMPEYVEGDRIEARYDNGVLQIVVPKSPAAQPRRIPIGRAEQSKQIES